MRGAASLRSSVRQVEPGRAALLCLSFPTMPIITVFENNNLGNQQTDLHTTVKNGYKLCAVNFNSLCGIVCLVSCIPINISFTAMTQENSSEKE